MSPQPEERDIIQNKKYISRVPCVFHPLTSDIFSVYFVHPIAFTSYKRVNAVHKAEQLSRLLLHTARLLIYNL